MMRVSQGARGRVLPPNCDPLISEGATAFRRRVGLAAVITVSTLAISSADALLPVPGIPALSHGAAFAQTVTPDVPSGLQGTGALVSGSDGQMQPQVQVKWPRVRNVVGYVIHRNGVPYKRIGFWFNLNDLKVTFTDTNVTPGATYSYTVNSFNNTTNSAKSAPVTVQAPMNGNGNKPTPTPSPSPTPAPSTAPATPTGFKGTATDDPSKGPLVSLTWDAYPAAANKVTSLKVVRNGVVLQAGYNPAWTAFNDYGDTAYDVTYSFSLIAVSSDGKESAPASVTVNMPSKTPTTPTPTPTPAPTQPTPSPTPPPTTTPIPAPPTDPAPKPAPVGGFQVAEGLRVKGLWNNGPTDVLSWNPVAGAQGYAIYQYDVPIAKLSGSTTSYQVPNNLFKWGVTYAITAIDASGTESLPSGLVYAQGSNNPSATPIWIPPAPEAPDQMTAIPEWQGSVGGAAGRPRIRLSWHAMDGQSTFTVYRDGQKYAEGVWGFYFIDSNVKAGESHSYAVSRTKMQWMNPAESGRSASVSVAAPSGPPASGGQVTIAKIVANDDSVMIYFNPVPGAVDYRCYTAAKPGTMKYSGGGLSIEMNGLDPTKSTTFVVEAVDKPGPFQKVDGMFGPGAMQHDGSVINHINGQGDPSNVPNVIAASAPFAANCTPVLLSGEQVFFDTFRGSKPLVQSASLDPLIYNVQMKGFNAPNNASNPYLKEFTNDLWRIRYYWVDAASTSVFFMSNHLMDTLYDGGSPGGTGGDSSPAHNNNASITFEPNAVADISGGKVLHVTMEVDAHFNARRWCDMGIYPAGDSLIGPALQKLEGSAAPTWSGNAVVWQIMGDITDPAQFVGSGNGTGTRLELANTSWYTDPVLGPSERLGVLDRAGKGLNGNNTLVDKRSKFDLYVSATRYRIVENGQVIKDAPLRQPLSYSKLQVYYSHHAYHTANDRDEVAAYSPNDQYWYNFRPWADERHWDNMGFEVINFWPN